MSNENTPDLRAAAERAADALEKACMQPMAYEVDEAHAAAADLRAALAQPAAQPLQPLTQERIDEIAESVGMDTTAYENAPADHWREFASAILAAAAIS